MPKQHNKVRIRNTHPALYRSIMTLSLMSVALAANFWTSNPTFNPYGIPKNLIGAVFFLLGASQLVFLNVLHDLSKVRLILAASLSFFLFWGLSNTQQSFAGKASFQLPILLISIAAFHLPLLIESPINPTTRRGD